MIKPPRKYPNRVHRTAPNAVQLLAADRAEIVRHLVQSPMSVEEIRSAVYDAVGEHYAMNPNAMETFLKGMYSRGELTRHTINVARTELRPNGRRAMYGPAK